jgi:hypothetical protein
MNDSAPELPLPRASDGIAEVRSCTATTQPTHPHVDVPGQHPCQAGSGDHRTGSRADGINVVLSAARSKVPCQLGDDTWHWLRSAVASPPYDGRPMGYWKRLRHVGIADERAASGLAALRVI